MPLKVASTIKFIRNKRNLTVQSQDKRITIVITEALKLKSIEKNLLTLKVKCKKSNTPTLIWSGRAVQHKEWQKK